MATDYVVERLDRVASTQDEARTRFRGRPVAVSANAQHAGRGRSGAGWINADRSLAVSVAFGLTWSPAAAPLMTLIAGLAARQVVGVGGVWLKWPNDLVNDDGDKLGGLLSELHDDVVVIGCGVNLYWEAPPAGMAGRFNVDPGASAPHELAESFVQDLLQRVAAGPGDWGREEYRRASSTLGEPVEWDGGFGRALDIDEHGGLVVVDAGGAELTLRSGAVRQVRPTTLSPTDGGLSGE